MKKIFASSAIFMILLVFPAPAKAWIHLSFPPYFAGTSIGVKGGHNFDQRGLLGLYADVSFIVFTGGFEVGHNHGKGNYMGRSVKLNYTYINPYLGVHLPLEPFDIYAVTGVMFIEQNSSTDDFNLGEHTAYTMEYGIRTAFTEKNLALGIGWKQHFFKEINTKDGNSFKPNTGMLFVSVGYYWDWE